MICTIAENPINPYVPSVVTGDRVAVSSQTIPPKLYPQVAMCLLRVSQLLLHVECMCIMCPVSVNYTGTPSSYQDHQQAFHPPNCEGIILLVVYS